jgi:hypothetical protein
VLSGPLAVFEMSARLRALPPSRAGLPAALAATCLGSVRFTESPLTVSKVKKSTPALPLRSTPCSCRAFTVAAIWAARPWRPVGELAPAVVTGARPSNAGAAAPPTVRVALGPVPTVRKVTSRLAPLATTLAATSVRGGTAAARAALSAFCTLLAVAPTRFVLRVTVEPLTVKVAGVAEKSTDSDAAVTPLPATVVGVGPTPSIEARYDGSIRFSPSSSAAASPPCTAAGKLSFCQRTSTGTGSTATVDGSS